jgi:hypothetical protein
MWNVNCCFTVLTKAECFESLVKFFGIKFQESLFSVEICVLLGYYAASNGNPLPTFRDNVSVPFSMVKKSKKKKNYAASNGNSLPTFRDDVSVRSSRTKKSKKKKKKKKNSWTSWPLTGPIRCPETSVKDYHSTLHNIPEERRSHQHRGGSLK